MEPQNESTVKTWQRPIALGIDDWPAFCASLHPGVDRRARVRYLAGALIAGLAAHVVWFALVGLFVDAVSAARRSQVVPFALLGLPIGFFAGVIIATREMPWDRAAVREATVLGLLVGLPAVVLLISAPSSPDQPLALFGVAVALACGFGGGALTGWLSALWRRRCGVD